ncbi:MAG: hypothetical protein E6K18_01915 [Methanobacteriota archaeon]|nr:MAG: hypothetical protein E6K18_01915 [Euryarchaeota archaeon]
MIEALDLGTFVTILLLAFAFVLLIAGAFTAYFGSGKSRKIGAGLLVGGIVIGIVWILLVRTGGPLDTFLQAGVVNVIVQSILILLAAFIGAGAAIGLFLLAIMKS